MILKHKREAERQKNHWRIYPTVNLLEYAARMASKPAPRKVSLSVPLQASFTFVWPTVNAGET